MMMIIVIFILIPPSNDIPMVPYWDDDLSMMVDASIEDIMKHPRMIPQIDLVPTISKLLGNLMMMIVMMIMMMMMMIMMMMMMIMMMMIMMMMMISDTEFYDA